MTRRIAAFLTGLAVLLTPARALSEGSVRGAEAQPRLGAAHAGSELVSTSGGTPDGDLGPSDERDPAPPLPAAAAAELLLTGAAAVAILRSASPRRIASAKRSREHAPRAPPPS